jgi:DNA adenine methylase
VEGLPAVHERLKRVLILNREALDVIRSEDGPRTLFYLDPPYLHETRATTGEYGPHEMTADQHAVLLDTLVGLKGKWMLSGYPSKLYESMFKDFRHTVHTFDLPNNAAGGKDKRRMVECVWCNF